MIRGVLLALVMAMPSTVSADTRLIERGLLAFERRGADAAVDVWMEGSMLQLAGVFDQVRAQLGRFAQLCGSLESWETLNSNNYGSRVTEQVMVLNFRRCPVFARFNTYTREGDEVLTRFNLNASYDKLLAASD